MSLLKIFLLFYKAMLKQQEVKFLKVMKIQKCSYITLITEHLVLLECLLVVTSMPINFKLHLTICLITKCTKRWLFIWNLVNLARCSKISFQRIKTFMLSRPLNLMNYLGVLTVLQMIQSMENLLEVVLVIFSLSTGWKMLIKPNGLQKLFKTNLRQLKMQLLNLMFFNGVKSALQKNLPLTLKLQINKNNQSFQSGKWLRWLVQKLLNKLQVLMI